MILFVHIHRRRVANRRLTVESQSRAVIIPFAAILVVELVTEHEAKVPLSIGTPLGSEVGCKQVVEDILLHATIFYFTFGVISRANFSNSSVVGGIHIDAGLLAKNEMIAVSPVQFRGEFSISIAKHTIGVLRIFIVCSPPIGVIEHCAAEQHLRCGISRLMIGRAFEVIFGWRRVHHVHNTAVGTRRRGNLYRAVVGRKTSLPLLVHLPVNGTACSCAGHAR